MANFNKVILVGRLTRDPETRTFANGGMVASFSFAVSNRKKNTQTGQWEDEPMYIDVSVFNRGEFGKLADLVRDRCRKGSQIMLEGRLHLDSWDDKTTGQKRYKHKIVADNIQLLDPRQGGGGGDGGYGGGYSEESGGGGYRGAPRSAPPQQQQDSYSGPDEMDGGMSESDIPF